MPRKPNAQAGSSAFIQKLYRQAPDVSTEICRLHYVSHPSQLHMKNLFPALVGSAVSFAFSAISGTASFNLFTWLESGTKFNFSQALDQITHYPMVYFVGMVLGAIGGVLGGYVASRVSKRQPYLAALNAGIFSMLWSVVMYASPVNESRLNIYAVLSSFILPVPLALLGARWHARQPTDG